MFPKSGFESCTKQAPLITWGNDSPLIVRNNLDQNTTTFTSYGQVPIPLAGIPFKAIANDKPTSHPFIVATQNMTNEQLKTYLRTEFSDYYANKQFSKTVANNNYPRTAFIVEEEEDGDTNNGNGGGTTEYYYVEYIADKELEAVTAHLINNRPKPLVPKIDGSIGGNPTLTYSEFVTPAVNPSVYVIEEYRTASFLGSYGAGRAVKTFSLLPGEETTISVKTYKDTVTTRSSSENVLDSFSQTSANELENLLQQETKLAESKNKQTQKSLGVSLSSSGLSGALSSISGNANASKNSSAMTSRSSNIDTLNKSIEKHVNNSNANRQIQVNTTTTETAKQGEEESIVRKLVNYNKNRVLNFVFRQLIQEYYTINYLSNIRIAFNNGYDDSTFVVNIENLDAFLNRYFEVAQHDTVRKAILKHYCEIVNFNGTAVKFIEPVTYSYGACVSAQGTETFYRIVKGLSDSYNPTLAQWFRVNGVILSIEKSTLRTSSVMVDAILGQGEALDCFNLKIQEAEAIKAQLLADDLRLKNAERYQRIAIIDAITDPQKKAEAYQSVFRTDWCCEDDDDATQPKT